MKKILTLLIACLLGLGVFSQSMVEDALRLSRSIASIDDGQVSLKRSDDSVFTILDKYYQSDVNNLKSDLRDAYSNNPFLVVSGGPDAFNWQAAAATGQAFVGDALNYVGGLNITNLADALAIVVVDRLKSELNQVFFNDFKKQLTDNPELNKLFPTTYTLLSTIDQSIYDYEAYIPALRQAFSVDLRNLYLKVDVFLNNPKFKEYYTKVPEIGAVVEAALITSKLVSQDKSPIRVITDMADATVGAPKKIEGLFRTVSLIAKSLHDSANAVKDVWVGMDKVKELIYDPAALRIYVGLLYQTSAEIKFPNGDSLQSKLKILGESNQFNKIADMVVVVSKTVQEVDALVKKYKADTTLKGYNKYYDYYESYTYLIKTIATSVDTIFKLDIDSSIQMYYAISQNIGNLYLNINEGSYTGAITNLVSTINIIDSAGNVMKKPVVQKLFRYGSFMAAMVEADNSQEMAAVLNNFILPSGSSSAKSKNSVLITINSYIGGFYSFNSLNSDSIKRSAGLTLPVGPNISFRVFKNCKGWVPAFFFPLVDIGAFGSYRLTDSSSATLPAVKLANIFAPGAMLCINRAFNSPLTIMGGIQRTPPLQTISASGATYMESSWRYQVSLVWDIPLFNLYYKPKK
ncbi:MAG: hypothetical protein ACO1PI_02190 [Bacteroidota bacterium]